MRSTRQEKAIILLAVIVPIVVSGIICFVIGEWSLAGMVWLYAQAAAGICLLMYESLKLVLEFITEQAEQGTKEDPQDEETI